MPENSRSVPTPNDQSPSSLQALPPHLVAYFRDGHLKVLGTISSDGPDKPIDWAVFASKKDAMPDGDPGFRGTVNGQGGCPRWKSQASLWLLPISAAARKAAAEAIKKAALPEIKAPEIVVRNPGHDAEFWYEEQ